MLCAGPLLDWWQGKTELSSWSFVTCPLEDECTNGHNNCDINEVCINLPLGFMCECKPRFARNERFAQNFDQPL